MKTRHVGRKSWLLLGALAALVTIVLLSGRGFGGPEASATTPPKAINICKVTVPAGGSGFPFTWANSFGPLPPFTLNDGQCQSFNVTNQDKYNVFTEIVPAGWTLTTIACSFTTSAVHIIGADPAPGFQPGDNAVAIDLNEQHVTCTFTNSQGITPTPTRTTCATPPSDLIAWYPLNEQNGATVVDDIAGFNNQGVPTAGALGSPGAPSAAAGQVGGALDFNSNFQSSGPHVEVANQSEIDVGTGDFSVDAWVKIPATSSAYAFPILDKLDYSSQTNGTGYALSVLTYGGPGGLVRLFMGAGGPVAQYLSAPSPSVIPYNTWSHVAVTVSRSAGTVTLYINGNAVPLSSPPPMPAGSISNTLPLFIGEIREPGKFQAETFVDELQLFKRALSTQDIQSIFNAGSAGKCTPGTPTPTPTGSCANYPSDLVAWYPLNEQNGATVVDDIAGFNNQGIPTAGALGSPGAPSAAAGQVGGALDFNANFQTSGPHVEVANQSEIDVGTGDFSVDAWVNVPATSPVFDAYPILDKLAYSPSGQGGTGYAVSLVSWPPGWLLRLFMGDGGPVAEYTSANNPPFISYNTWNHVAITVSRNAGTVTLYINGSPVALSHFPPSMPTGSVSNTLPLLVGEIREPNLPPGFAPVQAELVVDELQLFKRVLSPQNIQSIFNTGSAGKCTPTPTPTPRTDIRTPTATPTPRTDIRTPTATPTPRTDIRTPTATPTPPCIINISKETIPASNVGFSFNATWTTQPTPFTISPGTTFSAQVPCDHTYSVTEKSTPGWTLTSIGCAVVSGTGSFIVSVPTVRITVVHAGDIVNCQFNNAVTKPCGDVNDDGRVNSIDDVLVLQYIADLLHEVRNLPSADVNGDGRVNALDALLILQHIAGLDVRLVC